MNWGFILIAFTTHGATVERVLLDSPEQCVAYAKGYMGRQEMQGAYVQVAQCVGLRNSVVVPLKPVSTVGRLV